MDYIKQRSAVRVDTTPQRRKNFHGGSVGKESAHNAGPLIPPLPVGWQMAASLSFLRPPHQLIGEVADGYQIAGILLSSEIYI